MQHTIIEALMTIATFYALYADDIRVIAATNVFFNFYK